MTGDGGTPPGGPIGYMCLRDTVVLLAQANWVNCEPPCARCCARLRTHRLSNRRSNYEPSEIYRDRIGVIKNPVTNLVQCIKLYGHQAQCAKVTKHLRNNETLIIGLCFADNLFLQSDSQTKDLKKPETIISQFSMWYSFAFSFAHSDYNIPIDRFSF